MAASVVPFGKYKGQPVEVLAADREYCDWLAAQPWFRERFRDVYNIVVQMPGEERDTPEHNALQARFLDDALCIALWRHLHPRASNEADAPLDPLLAKARASFGSTVEAKRAERARLAGNGISEYYKQEVAKIDEWLAAVGPFLTKGTVWHGDVSLETPAVTRRAFEKHGVDVLIEVKFSASVQVAIAQGWGGRGFELGESTSLALEVKPAIGDDYPAVLRQVLRTREAGKSSRFAEAKFPWGTRFVVVTEAYTGSGATLEQVRAIYAASGVSLVLLADLADLVDVS